MIALTDKQEKFVLGLIAGESQREAYKAAYPKSSKWTENTIDARASRLFKSYKVFARYQELHDRIIREAEDRVVMTAIETLQKYTKLARFDIRKIFDDNGQSIKIKQLDDDTAACIVGIDVQELLHDGSLVGYVKKYKIADKKGALDSLARFHGLFNDKVQLSATVSVETLLKAVEGKRILTMPTRTL